jgi:hypothetical protein
MKTRSAVAVMAIVVASAAAGLEALRDRSQRSGERPPVEVNVEVETSQWRLGSTGFVCITVVNNGDEAIDHDVSAHLDLRARHARATASVRRLPDYADYWSPLDFVTMKNAAVGRVTRLTVPPRQRRAFVVRDAATLLWDRSISALWPARPLRDVVPPGDYIVFAKLIFEDDSARRVTSQPVEVTVRR